MKGVIKSFVSDKGYGFISGENGDIFFHVSNMMDKSIIPDVGMGVEYKEGENAKGPYAYDIKVTESIKPIFLKFGDQRIKLSDIKAYGLFDISSYWLENEEEWERTSPKAESVERVKESLAYKKASKGELKQLYVVTYSGADYRFTDCESDFDIFEKLKILDKYLCE